MTYWKRLKDRYRGLSLLEVLVAFLILLTAVLTLVGYTTTVYRASSEGKRQALASIEARSMLERIRDFPDAFEQASQPGGLSETRSEYLLDGEADATKNETGRKSSAQFEVIGTVIPLHGEVHQVVVTVNWQDDGRPRQVVLESRMIPIGR